MKITNLTTIETADLAALARRVAVDELAPGQLADVHIHFVWRKSRTPAAERARYLGFRVRRTGPITSGLRYNHAIVGISKQNRSPAAAALLIAHEFAEMRGKSHEQMRSPRYFFRKTWHSFYAYADAMPFRLKKPTVKARPTGEQLATQRLAHAQAKVKQWQSKVKRAETGLASWRRRVRYYERKLATPAVTPEAEAVG